MKKALMAVLMVMMISTGFGATFEDGVAACNRKDFPAAAKIFKELAEQGNAVAQYNLGVMYREGKGVPRDDKEAVKWYLKAAEQGDAEGQFDIGILYSLGKGVPQDRAESYFWLTLASGQASKYSQFRDLEARQLDPAKREEVKARCRKWLEDFQKRNAGEKKEAFQ